MIIYKGLVYENFIYKEVDETENNTIVQKNILTNEELASYISLLNTKMEEARAAHADDAPINKKPTFQQYNDLGYGYLERNADNEVHSYLVYIMGFLDIKYYSASTVEELENYIVECADLKYLLGEKERKIADKYNAMKEAEYPWSEYISEFENVSDIEAEIRTRIKKLNSKWRLNFFEIWKKTKEAHDGTVERLQGEESKLPRLADIGKHDEWADELGNRLAQTVIDYCLETNNHVIDEVHWGLDSIQGSLPFGEWCPCSDGNCTIVATVYDEEKKCAVREEIGYSI